MFCFDEVRDDDLELEVFSSIKPTKQKKQVKNGPFNLTRGSYIGTFLSVLFNPEDLNMFCLGPDYRRRYMDIILSQTNRTIFGFAKLQKCNKTKTNF